ncbi:Epidermal growth factor receptor [Hypsibius exemplaris]|uniref:receptor protein-tyrosine kinase n=1 Tax=Hypsibius exemplaris TaxID=2072580 RepID=A0A1W0X280_HYPEX|nr:Epidermal growth factor receptor [Hypsibius exemplaris]
MKTYNEMLRVLPVNIHRIALYEIPDPNLDVEFPDPRAGCGDSLAVDDPDEFQHELGLGGVGETRRISSMRRNKLHALQNENKTLTSPDFDSIREVTGYVLIARVDQDRVPTNSSHHPWTHPNGEQRQKVRIVGGANRDLRELGLSSLQEIMKGHIVFVDNPKLCHVEDSVDWFDILANNVTQSVRMDNSEQWNIKRQCPACSPSCEKPGDVAYCWGASSSSCQKRTKSTCASHCHPGRCFGKGAQECCHRECAAGCFGPKPTECLACRKFDHLGACLQNCPSSKEYDQETMTWKEKASQSKLAYGNICVDKCPDNMLQDDGACVRECSDGKIAKNNSNICTLCDGPCPKICRGFSKNNDQLRRNGHGFNFITGLNLQNFINCTIIEGDLVIMSQTFTEMMEFNQDPSKNRLHPPVHPTELEQLSTIREITGYFRLDATHPDLRSLSFLRNLEFIHGRTLDEKFALIIIISKFLTSLGLDLLKRINGGGVLIVENRQLCFANTVSWQRLGVSGSRLSPVVVRNNKLDEVCRVDGDTCHSECSSDGCWGKNATQCVSCTNFRLDKTCINSCKEQPNYFDAGGKVCQRCHAQCEGGCSGPSADDCTDCLNAREGQTCVATCGSWKYKDEQKNCRQCSALCLSCTGTGSFVGEGGYPHDLSFLRNLEVIHGWKLDECTCDKQVDEDSHHRLSFKFSSGRHSRHSSLNDVLKRALVSASESAIREPPGLVRQDGKQLAA